MLLDYMPLEFVQVESWKVFLPVVSWGGGLRAGKFGDQMPEGFTLGMGVDF